MTTKISFIITTFKERLELVKNLINNIKSYHQDNYDILLFVNSNNEEPLDNEYRKEILNIGIKYNNIYIFTLPEFKSLSKMWNTGVIFSNTEYNIILNDDIEYKNPNIINNILNFIHTYQCEFFTINYSFSHFVITKTMLHKLGYFDERLLAFGEEDGDIVHRYIEMFNLELKNIMIYGIINSNRYDLSSPNLQTHINNKPAINRKIAELKYKSDPSGITGMSPVPLKKIWDDYQQYPYEMFVKLNKHNIKQFTNITLNNE